MIDIKVYREYWEGVQKRIPEIKKVLPVTIDEEMSKTIQGLSKEECPVLFILIQVTFINRLIINCLYNCIAYNMPTFLIYYRLFLT